MNPPASAAASKQESHSSLSRSANFVPPVRTHPTLRQKVAFSPQGQPDTFAAVKSPLHPRARVPVVFSNELSPSLQLNAYQLPNSPESSPPSATHACRAASLASTSHPCELSSPSPENPPRKRY